MFERFDNAARLVVVHMQNRARERHHPFMAPAHLAQVLTEHGALCDLIRASGASMDDVAGAVEAALANEPTLSMLPPHLPFTQDAKRVMELALREALQLGQNVITPAHLLLGLARSGTVPGFPAVDGLRKAYVASLPAAEKTGTTATGGGTWRLRFAGGVADVLGVTLSVDDDLPPMKPMRPVTVQGTSDKQPFTVLTDQPTALIEALSTSRNTRGFQVAPGTDDDPGRQIPVREQDAAEPLTAEAKQAIMREARRQGIVPDDEAGDGGIHVDGLFAPVVESRGPDLRVVALDIAARYQPYDGTITDDAWVNVIIETATALHDRFLTGASELPVSDGSPIQPAVPPWALDLARASSAYYADATTPGSRTARSWPQFRAAVGAIPQEVRDLVTGQEQS